MSGESSRQVLRHLNSLFRCGVNGPLSDEELLEQFVAGSADRAEAAFAALVNRHGAMVLGVCRRVLGHRHSAEDAFQATFLVLARKAPVISQREQLASWLHGVARRAAMDARVRAARQVAKEKRLGIMSPSESIDEIHRSELRLILDEELARLPERHRAAILLCELEGLSRREAARQLGVSEGTLSSRLARAKVRLRERLTRRGLALSAATLTFALAQDAQAMTLPASLVASTIRFATWVGTGSSVAGVASTSVITLTEGVLKAMLLSKLKFAFIGLVAVAIVTTGAGVVAQDRPSENDRLKNLELKMDRLLEAFGSQNQRAISATRTQDSKPEPKPTPLEEVPPLPAVRATPAAVVALPQPPQPPAEPAVNPRTPFAQIQPSPARVAMPAAARPFSPPVTAAPYGRSTHPDALADRVEKLESRFTRLERRLAEIEQQLSGSNSSPSTALPATTGPQALPTPRAQVAPSPSITPSSVPVSVGTSVPIAAPPPAPPAPSAPIAPSAEAAPPPPTSEPVAVPEVPGDGVSIGAPETDPVSASPIDSPPRS